MPLADPVAVYNAENNVEAHFLCGLLIDLGVEAHVTEDVSVVGLALFGPLPEIHKPQVWIDRKDLERAKAVLEGYERRLGDRQGVTNRSPDSPIEVVCEECGKVSVFPAEMWGTVQECPHCGEFMDVGDDDVGDEWRVEGGDEAAESGGSPTEE